MHINARWVAAAAVFAAVTGLTTGSVAASAATSSTSSPAESQKDSGLRKGEARECVASSGMSPKKLSEEQRAKLKERLGAGDKERPKLLEGLPDEPGQQARKLPPRGLGEKLRKAVEGEKEDRARLKERIREGGKVCHVRGDAKDQDGKRIRITDGAVVKALAAQLKVSEDDARRALKALAELGERPGGLNVDRKEGAAVAEELGITAEQLKAALEAVRKELGGHSSDD